jgi:hypothetical protein
MKYLVVTPWNTSNPSAYLAREFIRPRTAEHDFVVLCPGQETWAEDFALERVHVHTFGETLHFPNDEVYEYDPQLHQLDFVLVQLVFYCKQYTIDKVLIFGNMYSAFEIVARIRLMKNAASSDPFQVPVRVVLSGLGNKPTEEVPNTLYLETYRDVAENVFLLQHERLTSFFADETVQTFTVPAVLRRPSTIEQGRNDLERVVGLRLPAHSYIKLCMHPTNEDALKAVEFATVFFSQTPSLAEDDRTLFWIVQHIGSDEVVRKIREGTELVQRNVLYTASKMSTEAVDAILASANELIYSDPYFQYAVPGQTQELPDFGRL